MCHRESGYRSSCYPTHHIPLSPKMLLAAHTNDLTAFITLELSYKLEIFSFESDPDMVTHGSSESSFSSCFLIMSVLLIPSK